MVILIINLIYNFKYDNIICKKGKTRDSKLVSVNSIFYNKPEEYSMAIYSYYMCYKCQKPYYGGLKDCERAVDEQP